MISDFLPSEMNSSTTSQSPTQNNGGASGNSNSKNKKKSKNRNNYKKKKSFGGESNENISNKHSTTKTDLTIPRKKSKADESSNGDQETKAEDLVKAVAETVRTITIDSESEEHPGEINHDEEPNLTSSLNPLDMSDISVIDTPMNTSAWLSESTVVVQPPAEVEVEAPVLDEFAESLADGQSIEVHGIVLNCAWPWAVGSLKHTYDDLKDRIENLICEEVLGDEKCNIQNVCYIYKPTELHCTIATLSSFKHKSSYFSTCDNATRLEILNRFNDVIESVVRENFKNFSMTVSSIEVGETACIFHFTDNSGIVELLRSSIQRALSNDPELNLFLSNHDMIQDIHIPNIIHSTFIRFRRTPSTQFVEKLKNIFSSWKPIQVEVYNLWLVHENRPYMHVDRNETSIYSYSQAPPMSPSRLASNNPVCEIEEEENSRLEELLFDTPTEGQILPTGESVEAGESVMTASNAAVELTLSTVFTPENEIINEVKPPAVITLPKQPSPLKEVEKIESLEVEKDESSVVIPQESKPNKEVSQQSLSASKLKHDDKKSSKSVNYDHVSTKPIVQTNSSSFSTWWILGLIAGIGSVSFYFLRSRSFKPFR